MKSIAVSAGDIATAAQYNNLRQDAYASSMLLAHEQSTPDLTLKVEAGEVYFGSTLVSYAGGNSPTFTAPSANPRIDVLSIDSSGTLVRTAGSEAASPSAPAVPAGNVPICRVYNRVGQTTIRDTDTTGQGYIQKDARGFINAPYKAGTFNINEKTGVDISAGQPVFIDSNGEAIKAPTLNGVVAASRLTKAGISGTTSYTSDYGFTWLKDNAFAAIYCIRDSTSNFAVVAMGKIDKNGQIGLWDEQVLTSGANTYSQGIIRLSDTLFVAMCSTGSATSSMYACSIDATNKITVGSASSIGGLNATTFGGHAIVPLTSTTYLLGYVNSSNSDIAARVCSVSGTTITQNTELIVETGTFTYCSLAALTSTKAIITTYDGTNTKSRALNISSTTVTAGANAYNIVAASKPTQAIRMSDTSFVVVYDNSNVTAIAGSISGDVITFGSGVTGIGASNGSNCFAVSNLGLNRFIIYKHSSAASGAAMGLYTLSGTTITLNSYYDSIAYKGIQVSSVLRNMAFIEGHLFLAIADDSVGFITQIMTFAPTITESLLGVSLGTDNSKVTVFNRGLSDAVFSGFTHGRNYYADTDGTLSTSGVVYVGKAIGTDKLLVDF